MTWQRILSRNHLRKGGYDDPADWKILTNTSSKDDGSEAVSRTRREHLVILETKAKNLLGDLRRLEKDALDEDAIVKTISFRLRTTSTAVDENLIAAVLKEFMAL
jgi:hypothetical protein